MHAYIWTIDVLGLDVYSCDPMAYFWQLTREISYSAQRKVFKTDVLNVKPNVESMVCILSCAQLCLL